MYVLNELFCLNSSKKTKHRDLDLHILTEFSHDKYLSE